MLSTQMETLLSVVEQGSFTRAAEALSLTQPAVSHHIRQLEQDLNIPIFIRGKGALKLTDKGEIAVKYARRLKAMPNRMENILAYVNANLLDATLSLDMVANHFKT